MLIFWKLYHYRLIKWIGPKRHLQNRMQFVPNGNKFTNCTAGFCFPSDKSGLNGNYRLAINKPFHTLCLQRIYSWNYVVCIPSEHLIKHSLNVSKCTLNTLYYRSRFKSLYTHEIMGNALFRNIPNRLAIIFFAPRTDRTSKPMITKMWALSTSSCKSTCNKSQKMKILMKENTLQRYIKTGVSLSLIYVWVSIYLSALEIRSVVIFMIF